MSCCTTCQVSECSTPICNRTCYDINCAGKEKDILISQLKAHIFELELREKDFNSLKERYNQLLHDIACLNDCKNQLECEKKARDCHFNQNINQLENENQSLQIGFNEKLSNNKTIFTENNVLGKQIEFKGVEICQLNAKINELNCQILRNNEDRNNLQKAIAGLSDINASQNVKISQLIDDNKTLKDIVNEQDCCLKAGEQERAKLVTELEATNAEIQNLNCTIRQRINDATNLQNQLNNANSMNVQLQNNLKDLQIHANNLKCDNNNLNSNLIKETSIRVEENQKNNQLNAALNDRENQINLLNHDINEVKLMQQNASAQNCVLQDENAKLKNHVMVLTDLNQNLNDEIESVICEDEKMRCILDRQDRINSVLASNRCTIDQSLNSLDKGINKIKCINCVTPCNVICDC